MLQTPSVGRSGPDSPRVGNAQNGLRGDDMPSCDDDDDDMFLYDDEDDEGDLDD